MAAKSKPRASAEPKRPFAERNGKLMSVREAADYLGITERFIRRLVHEGELPYVKVGKLLRLHIEDLDAYIAARRGTTDDEAA